MTSRLNDYYGDVVHHVYILYGHSGCITSFSIL